MDVKTKTVLQSPIAENVHSEGECEQLQIILQGNNFSIHTHSVGHPSSQVLSGCHQCVTSWSTCRGWWSRIIFKAIPVKTERRYPWNNFDDSYGHSLPQSVGSIYLVVNTQSTDSNFTPYNNKHYNHPLYSYTAVATPGHSLFSKSRWKLAFTYLGL